MFVGLLVQQPLGSGASFLESIPTSIQTLLGMVAILGASWTWFVRPRMIRIVVEAVTQSERSLRSELTEKIEASEERLRREIAANRREVSEKIEASEKRLRRESAEIRRESREAHATIGERIDGVNDRIDRLQMHFSKEVSVVRGEIADVKTDTAKLAGAIDVLTKIQMEGSARG